ncbi:MAG: hypothetical protein CSA36_06445, partial [Draconibacterium sp.]
SFPKNEYFLFTPEITNDLFPEQGNFQVVSPKTPFSKAFKSFWRSFSLSRQLKNYGLEIFHGLSNELPEGIHTTSIPAVVTIHDLIFMEFPHFYKPMDRKIYYTKVRYACSAAKKIIAISSQTKEDLVRFFKVDENKIELVFQSVSPVYFEQPEMENLTGKYGLRDEYLISVGTLEPRKNQLALLQAIQQQNIDTQVVLVGKTTSYSNELVKYISANNMNDQVKLLSRIPQTDLAALYRGAKLSVYMSLYEGFGLPVIESMAAGCPVVTSNVSCLPETAGGAAVLCDPSDVKELGAQIKAILSSEQLRKELIQKGRERAMVFHPDYFSKKMASLYESLI